ncbi:hypothetical protein Tco_0977440 [Tanacetum coccineum]|uniref:Uncharacterized protein n=1 Tax=Tanacetum coccineum TaxID=301880 RepID=A0ABQ5EK40_9ASTR
MSHRSSSHVDNSAIVKLRFKLLLGLRPLKNLLEDGQGLDNVIWILSTLFHPGIRVSEMALKRLKQSRIPIVKVRWNSRRGPEYTWECEDQMQKKYPHLFANPDAARPLILHLCRRYRLALAKVLAMDLILDAYVASMCYIMAASAIIISSDSSDESVGSPPSWVILFGDNLPDYSFYFMVAPRELLLFAPVISPRSYG